MAHRKWKETKQKQSMLPGPAVPGSCLASFHFLLAILCPQAVPNATNRGFGIIGVPNPLHKTASINDCGGGEVLFRLLI